MDSIDLFLGAALASLSGVVLTLWTRVMVQVSNMKHIGNAPEPVQGGRLESSGETMHEKSTPH